MPGLGSVRQLSRRLHHAETEFRKRIWQRWHHGAKATQPVFLVGNGRSGTSMLVFHLTRSWYINLYNEDNPAAFEQWFLREFEIIDRLLTDSPAPITMLKPIKDTYRIHQIMARYPTAKILFAFRHFDDVVNSARKRFYVDFGKKIGKTVAEIVPPATRWMQDDFAEYSDAPPPTPTKSLIRSLWQPEHNLETNIALHWLFVNSLYFDRELVKQPQVLLIHYESLVSAPQASFQRICTFLEIPFMQKMVADVYATSINKKAAPDIAPEVRAACDTVWQRLCHAYEKTAT